MIPFGKERLIDLIRNIHTMPAKEIINAIQREVSEFAGHQPQFDDITLMVVKVA